MTDAKVFTLEQLRSELEKEGGYFVDFIKVRKLEAGIIVLHPGEEDTQEPHQMDELYYVIDGHAQMKLGKRDIQVTKGSTIFVPAGMNHRFFGNKEDLVVLYVFAG